MAIRRLARIGEPPIAARGRDGEPAGRARRGGAAEGDADRPSTGRGGAAHASARKAFFAGRRCAGPPPPAGHSLPRGQARETCEPSGYGSVEQTDKTEASAPWHRRVLVALAVCAVASAAVAGSRAVLKADVGIILATDNQTASEIDQDTGTAADTEVTNSSRPRGNRTR